MIFNASPPTRRFLVPEVVQTSAMDCGPATLKSLLEGFDVSVSYGRLREACQTDVDGTSIDTMEDIAVQLGLDAEQIMLPPDHLFLPESQALPAIIVVRLPNGLTHFVVIWNTYGRFVQIMDPAIGRRWMTQKRFLRDVYIHTYSISSNLWLDWSGSEGFCDPLRRRLANLEIEEPMVHQLIETALEDQGWLATASLDAATRLVDALVRAKGLEPGKEAGNVLERFFDQARRATPDEAHQFIPGPYWSVYESGDDETQLLLRGAVLVRATGRHTPEETAEGLELEKPTPLSPDLAAALEEPEARPELKVLQTLREDGLLTPSILLIALALATFGVTIEAMLFKGLLDIGQHLELIGQRIGAIQAFFIFLFALLFLELPIASTAARIGRRLEMRLRIAFLEKIPRLGDRYFHSRLTSDMAQRAYELRQLRMLPNLALTFFRLLFQFILTTAGIIWLTPFSAPIAILTAIVAICMSFITQPLIREQDMRFRTHVGALSRFYLDALLGLIPIRTHGASKAVRREHESLLVDWVHAAMELFRVDLSIFMVEAVISAGFAVWLLFNHIAHQGEASGVLLLLYWTLKLPILGQGLSDTAQQYPTHRNRILRLLEPLSAPEESEKWYEMHEEESASVETQASGISSKEQTSGVAIDMHNVSVNAGGHTILSEVEIQIASGEHVAIVGPSGAGKSSLVGLLLGWHRPATGSVRADGKLLHGDLLHAMRREIAWVDPAIQLWNRTLQENLQYGSRGAGSMPMNLILQQADLLEILENLPSGPQTRLGESGGLVSGGEGQRVRLGRAIYRPGVRLVILDEPFRGLDRPKRRELLRRARQHWQNATLLFISHDIGEALSFQRVMVIENGRIVEDHDPNLLMQQADSRYRILLESEEAVRRGLWESTDWRRLWLEKGQLKEK